MKKRFGLKRIKNKIIALGYFLFNLSFSNTWKCWGSGEEELEIVSHGWAQKLTSFEQETGYRKQNLPRNGEPFLKSVVQDAQRNLTQLPFFFFHFTSRLKARTPIYG
jgi:hypothetical protein